MIKNKNTSLKILICVPSSWNKSKILEMSYVTENLWYAGDVTLDWLQQAAGPQKNQAMSSKEAKGTRDCVQLPVPEDFIRKAYIMKGP